MQGTNRLLKRLTREDYDRLAPHMQRVRTEFKQTLIDPFMPIKYAHFPETGVISVVTELEEGGVIESGTIGNEGFVGSPLIMGVEQTGTRYLAQVPGHAIRLPAEIIVAERSRGGPFFDDMLRVTYSMMAMLSQSVACNRAHPVEQRMCRWLLMTHDRVEGAEFPLTQEFLAQMLGVHRPAVNVAGTALQRAGLIKYSRGRITILDRTGLEAASCECYGRVQEEFARAFADDTVERASASGSE